MSASRNRVHRIWGMTHETVNEVTTNERGRKCVDWKSTYISGRAYTLGPCSSVPCIMSRQAAEATERTRIVSKV